MSQAISAQSRPTKTSRGKPRRAGGRGWASQMWWVKVMGFLTRAYNDIWDVWKNFSLFPQSLWKKHKPFSWYDVKPEVWDFTASCKKDRMVDQSQSITSPSTKTARSKSEHHKWLLVYLTDCFWTQSCTGGYSNNSSCCRDDSQVDQSIALTPIDSASLHHWTVFVSVLMQQSALMLSFEVVRSQISSYFFYSKWDMPTDCLEKTVVSFLFLSKSLCTAISVQKGVRNWEEKAKNWEEKTLF